MRGFTDRIQSLPAWPLIAILLIVFAVQAVMSMRLLSASSDEVTHLASGYTYLKTGRLRLNPEHPPLMKMLAAAPLLILQPRLDLNDPAWKKNPPDQWQFGRNFLYSNDADRLLLWGRLPVIALGLLLGIHVYLWARDLFGRGAGILATFLYAFCPNIIAHSRFVTMDLALSCFFTVALFYLWRLVKNGGTANMIASGLALGFALSAKFSAVILIPAFLLLVILAAFWPERRSVPVKEAAIILAIAGLLVWAIYLFPLDPLFYWKGIQEVNKNHNPDYPAYLLGDFQKGGWWYYFMVAFFFKTPLPTLLLLAIAALRFRSLSADRLDELFLIVPAVSLIAFTSALADNIGLRYILPAFPLLFIFVSRAANLLWDTPRLRLATAALGAWYVTSALWIYPDHLAYFNLLAGGPANGHKVLDDSNIDWGQDLKRVAAYLRDQGIDRVKLIYPWPALPEYYHIKTDPVTTRDWYVKPSPGIYVVSTHVLIRGELSAKTTGAYSNWLTLYKPIGRVGYSFYIFKFE